MKLVKEHINEKFESDSDPIRDMHIGGINLLNVFKEIAKKGPDKIKWEDYLNQFVGKKVTFTRKNHGDEKTMIIKSIRTLGMYGDNVYFFNENLNNWSVDLTKRIYVDE